MSALFPAPVHAYTTYSDDKSGPTPAPSASAAASSSSSAVVTRATRAVPSYPHRVKSKFIPRSAEDFGDGGAYPEIHLAQFPHNMGKKGGGGSSILGSNSSSSNTLALQVRGEDGQVGYDAVVTQHHRNKTKVYTKFSDIVEKDTSASALELPSRDEEIETANRTKDALQVLVQGKIAASLPVNVSRQKTAKESSTYIRYTPNDQGKMGGQSQQRIIRMVDVAKDPMEPPKFQHKKAVRGPPSPPVPVLHSPPRKLTVQDQQSWKIPPMISNWKNSKGFTIALDKRLAADGRGLQQVTVNDNFASLSEALAIAERKAREEVNMRATVQKKLAMKQKEQKENELRDLASKARMERSGIHRDEEARDEYHGDDQYRREGQREGRAHSHSDRGSSDDEDRGRGDDDDDPRGRRERDQIRRERKKERERELRMQKIGKKGKLARDDDRDVSEKIALGQLQGAGKLSGDALFDSRLFNQSQGISSGFGPEDDYTVYSKPLVDRGKASVYRPKGDNAGFGDADKQMEDLQQGHTKRFKADKQFRGTEQVGHGRDRPVQFSYDTAKDEDNEDEDKSRSSAATAGRGRGRSPPPRAREQRRHSPSRSASRSRSKSRSRSPSYSRSRTRRRSPSRSRGRVPAPARRQRSYSRSRSSSRGRGGRGGGDRDDRKRSRRDGSDNDSDDDPFGLDQFLTDARKGKDDKPSSSSRRR